MPSKGIQVYSYISIDGYEIEFSVPKQTVRHTSANNFTSKHLEVESHNIPGIAHYTGRFEWKVIYNGEIIASAFNDINSFTGNIEGGNMTATQSFVPIVTDEVVVTYCFYDAGHGEFGLTNLDQCYVTVCSTSNRYWMGSVAPPGSLQAQKPFSRFVIAAPHDNGMNSMRSCDAILKAADLNMGSKLRQLIPKLRWFSHIPDDFILQRLPDIVSVVDDIFIHCLITIYSFIRSNND